MIKLPFFLSYVLGLLFLYYVLVMIGTTAVVNCEQETHDNTDQNHNQENREWKLHLLDLEKYPLATCLDGSPGAYYIRPGAAADNVMTTNDNTKVFLHIEGGGWCCDTCSETCYERSKTYLGSTANDTTLGDFTYEKAYYNMNKTINPAVWDFSSVYVRYCDVSIVLYYIIVREVFVLPSRVTYTIFFLLLYYMTGCIIIRITRRTNQYNFEQQQ